MPRRVPRGRRLGWLWLAWLVLGLGMHSTTAAQPQGTNLRKQAAALFARGVEYYDDGQYQRALKVFERAYRMAPHPTVRINMASCFTQLSRPVEALFNFERFLRESGGRVSDAQRGRIRVAMAELETQVGELHLSVEPRNATVHIGGRTPRALPDGRVMLAAGKYTVEAFARGHEPFSKPLVVTGAQPKTLDIRLRALPPATSRLTPPPPHLPGAATAETLPRSGRSEVPAWWKRKRAHRTLAGLALGMGLLGVGVGATAIAREQKFDEQVRISNDTDRTSSQRRQAEVRGVELADRANRLAATADGLWISAAMFGAGALTAWLLSKRSLRLKEQATPAAWLPVVGRQHAGVALSGRF